MNFSRQIVSIDDDTSELNDVESRISKEIFKVSLEIRRLIGIKEERTPPPVHASGVKLPKIDIPKCDGSILSWINFWEPFEISVHRRTQISYVGKLAYL